MRAWRVFRRDKKQYWTGDSRVWATRGGKVFWTKRDAQAQLKRLASQLNPHLLQLDELVVWPKREKKHPAFALCRIAEILATHSDPQEIVDRVDIIVEEVGLAGIANNSNP